MNFHFSKCAYFCLGLLTAILLLTSCQDTTTDSLNSDESTQKLIGEIIDDPLVRDFIVNTHKYQQEVTNRIEMHQEKYDEYIESDNVEKITELIMYDGLSDVHKSIQESFELISVKYPTLTDIDGESVDTYYKNNPGSQNIDLAINSDQAELRGGCGFWGSIWYAICVDGCPIWPGYASCANSCYWQHCSWSCPGYC